MWNPIAVATVSHKPQALPPVKFIYTYAGVDEIGRVKEVNGNCSHYIVGYIEEKEQHQFRCKDSTIKGQMTPIFNLLCIRSTIPLRYVGASFRTEIYFKLIKLAKIYLKSCGEARKNKS